MHRAAGWEKENLVERVEDWSGIHFRLLTTFEKHCDGRPVEDDVTVLLVERVE